MKMSKFIELLSSDFKALGKLGGQELDSAVSRLIPTLTPVLRTRLLEALTEIAEELSEQLPGAHLEARIQGDEIELIYIEDSSTVRENPADLNARITLRLPEDLKSRIESAATNEGISLNSWLLKASDRNSLSITIGKRQLRGKGKS
ncbi:MAG: pilus assembly protein HicB [Actinobacteria bacterium]|jgi:predicted DNA binding CopG/RHH family protein|nr:pilus assembly protein HicB [Actinomycetota bacterium]